MTIAPRADRNVLLVTIDTLRADAMSLVRRPRQHAQSRRARGGRCALHVRARACRRHAAVAHASLLTGRVSVRARRARQQRLSRAHGSSRRWRRGSKRSASRPAPSSARSRSISATASTPGSTSTTIASARSAAPWTSRCPSGAPTRSSPPRSPGSARRRTSGSPGSTSSIRTRRIRPPEEFATRYPDDPYAAEVAWTDAALAPLFDALSSQPAADARHRHGDHGESLGDHGELTHGIFAYESTLHVPLIVAEVSAGRVCEWRAGVTIESPARHVDILPTVLDALGAPPDPKLAGHVARGRDRGAAAETIGPRTSRR